MPITWEPWAMPCACGGELRMGLANEDPLVLALLHDADGTSLSVPIRRGEDFAGFARRVTARAEAFSRACEDVDA